MSVKKVLVVDDEFIERDGLRYLIESKGFPVDVLEAPNGREALDVLRSQPIDILVSDIRMPFMDGLELMQHARTLDPKLTILLYTAYSEFEYARKAIELGAFGYLLKPIDPDNFHDQFARALLRCSTSDTVHEETLDCLDDQPHRLVEQTGQGICRALEAGDVEQAQIRLEKLGRLLEGEAALSMLFLKCSCSKILQAIAEYCHVPLQDQVTAMQAAWHADNRHDIRLLLLRWVSMLDTRAGQQGTADVIERVRAYIDANYTQQLSLDDLARDFYLTPNYLSALFHQKTGETISRYMTQRRMENAAFLLTHSEKTITEIAGEVGYVNIPYFSRLFRATYSTRPSQYRKENGRKQRRQIK